MFAHYTKKELIGLAIYTSFAPLAALAHEPFIAFGWILGGIVGALSVRIQTL